MMKIRNYKIWVLVLRAILFAIPITLIIIGDWAEKLCDWLNVILPHPRKS